MALEHYKQEFKALLSKVDQTNVISFLKWVKTSTDDQLKDLAADVRSEDAILNQIQSDLRDSIPLEAVLPSERVIKPEGKNADCDACTTLHVDGFLYDEEAIDELVDQGKMSRNYCKSCGSRDVSPLTFISHSTSRTQVQYMFQYLLPDLRGKRVLDVGSRLGPVLYGAYLYSGASQIIGVEMNSDLCHIQKTVIDKYRMQDRVQIICDDICKQQKVLEQADVIILNNVFEFFLPQEDQKRIWTLIRSAVRRSGVILIVSPSLESSLEPLQLVSLMESWVRPTHCVQGLQAAEWELFDDPDDTDLEEIYTYTVL